MKQTLIKHLEQRIEKYEKKLLEFHGCNLGVTNLPKKSYLLGRLHELTDLMEVLKSEN